jgi:hypothetical protein
VLVTCRADPHALSQTAKQQREKRKVYTPLQVTAATDTHAKRQAWRACFCEVFHLAPDVVHPQAIWSWATDAAGVAGVWTAYPPQLCARLEQALAAGEQQVDIPGGHWFIDLSNPHCFVQRVVAQPAKSRQVKREVREESQPHSEKALDSELAALKMVASVKVIGAADQVLGDGTTVMVYVIECTPVAGSAPWHVRRRFSDFDNLSTVLESRGMNRIALPSKIQLFKSKESIKNERTKQLDTWMNSVFKVVNDTLQWSPTTWNVSYGVQQRRLALKTWLQFLQPDLLRTRTKLLEFHQNLTLANIMQALKHSTTKAVRTHGSRSIQKMLDEVSAASEMRCLVDPSSPPLVVLIDGDQTNVTTTAGYVVQAWNRAAGRVGVTGLNKNWYVSNHMFAVSIVDVHMEVAQGSLPDGCSG